MAQDIETHIQKCKRCLHFKSRPHKTKFNLIIATHSLELVCIDFLTTGSGKTDKDVNILVITDHFTQYVLPLIALSQTTIVTAQTLLDISLFAVVILRKNLSDQGQNVESI